METQTERVFVNYTPDEVRKLAEVLSDEISKKEADELELKGIKQQFKTDIEAADARITSSARKIRERGFYDRVECCVIRDFHEKEFYVIRPDTSEIVRYRSMRNDELQVKVDDEAFSEEHCYSVDEVKTAFESLNGEPITVRVAEPLFYGEWELAAMFREWMVQNLIEFGPVIDTGEDYREITLTPVETVA